MTDPRSHRRAREYRAAVRVRHEAEHRPCWRCTEPIDYTLPSGHPMCWEWDHPKELDAGGALYGQDDQASHLHCNRRAGALYGHHKRKLGLSPRDW